MVQFADNINCDCGGCRCWRAATSYKEGGKIMKVCESCGIEIGGKDGENHCPACDDKPRSKREGLSRKERQAIMESLGLVKVRGALGGTYYE